MARTPRLWPLCFVPLLAALLVYVGVGVASGLWLVPRLPGWLGVDEAGPTRWVVQTLGSLGMAVLWLFLFQFVFVLFAGVFSGLVWDRLSLAVEQTVAGPASAPLGAGLGWGAQARDGLSRFVVNSLLGVLAFGLGPIPGLAAAAVVGLLDYTAPAYGRRGLTLGPQWARLRRPLDRATLGFAFAAGFLSLVPVVGVFLIPGLVAGGTLLARRREG